MLLRLSISTVRRSTGRSACAASAYRSGEPILDARLGRVYRYRRRRDRIGFTALVGWAGNRSELWNCAEFSEKRKDSVTARECLLTLFAELTQNENNELAVDYALWLRTEFGVAIDIAVHDDEVGPHAHLLFTTRAVSNDGSFGARTALDDRFRKGPEAVRMMREKWRDMANRALQQAGESCVEYPNVSPSQVAGIPTMRDTFGGASYEQDAVNSLRRR